MKYIITERDIIDLNKLFDRGTIINETSLDFALSYVKKTENWTKAAAYIVRAILLDHVFEEGNKRTAALLVKVYAECEGYKIYDDKLLKMIKNILLKNITDINQIEEMIKDAVR